MPKFTLCHFRPIFGQKLAKNDVVRRLDSDQKVAIFLNNATESSLRTKIGLINNACKKNSKEDGYFRAPGVVISNEMSPALNFHG